MELILRLLSEPAIFAVFILIFVCITFIIFHFANRTPARIYSIVCMCVWGFGLLYVTWLSRTPILETRINLLPFQPDVNTAAFDHIANIVMFIPFPILLYGVLQKQLRLSILFVSGVGLSLALELLQLITHRGVCDVEDLILNSAGALIGAIATIMLLKTRKES